MAFGSVTVYPSRNISQQTDKSYIVRNDKTLPYTYSPPPPPSDVIVVKSTNCLDNGDFCHNRDYPRQNAQRKNSSGTNTQRQYGNTNSLNRSTSGQPRRHINDDTNGEIAHRTKTKITRDQVITPRTNAYSVVRSFSTSNAPTLNQVVQKRPSSAKVHPSHRFPRHKQVPKDQNNWASTLSSTHERPQISSKQTTKHFLKTYPSPARETKLRKEKNSNYSTELKSILKNNGENQRWRSVSLDGSNDPDFLLKPKIASKSLSSVAPASILSPESSSSSGVTKTVRVAYTPPHQSNQLSWLDSENSSICSAPRQNRHLRCNSRSSPEIAGIVQPSEDEILSRCSYRLKPRLPVNQKEFSRSKRVTFQCP